MHMHTNNGHHQSVWMATTGDLQPTPLTEDARTDVCIIGAGIAGLTTASLLAAEGKSVMVLDDGPVGGGESSRTTAHLVTALDDRYIDLEAMHGRENVRLVAESHAAAIDEVERIVKEEQIDCGFVRLDGYLFVTPGEEKKLLEDEREAAHRAGLRDVEIMEQVPDLSFETGPCLRFPRQAQFHIMRYLYGLARSIERQGGRTYTFTHAESIEGGKEARVTTSDGKSIHASSIVVATNTPVNDRVVMHTKQAAYRTYVLAFEIPKGSVPRILLWDSGPYSTGDRPVPYHYIRIDEEKDRDLLIVGGEDHKTGQAHDAPLRLNRLEEWTRKRFPMAGNIRHSWSGQVMEPADGLAYIGHNPVDQENVYIATGDSGNGMTHGTIAGMLLRDLILGRTNPWQKLYSPSRKPIHAFKQFARENLNVAREYMDLLKPGKALSKAEIQHGSGTVVQQGTKKIALYRDAQGKSHAFSAICPHLGCVVGWNEYEKSWDCPCHGSRFTALGQVVNGPANGDLSQVNSTSIKRSMIYTCPMHPEIRWDEPGSCPECSMQLVPEGTMKQKQQTEKGFFRTYQPLFVIIGMIALVTLVLAWRDSMEGMVQWRDVMQNFMAGFFLVFSGFKFLDLPGFAKGYATYDLLARKVKAYGYVYPSLELLLGLSYLARFQPPLTNTVTLILMLFSGLGVTVSLLQGRKFQCACLGTIIKVPLTTVTLVEDFGMAAMAAVMLLA